MEKSHSAAAGQLSSSISLIDCPPFASFRPMGTLYPPVPQMRLLLAPPCQMELVATGQSSPPQSMEPTYSAPHGVHPRGALPQPKKMRRTHLSFSSASRRLCARFRALSAGPIARYLALARRLVRHSFALSKIARSMDGIN
ncbi:hypothetical protein niasHT_014451 [Heterodera trifolii]|uniref:Uncharacterized protein n=1 Tax=Heterodera trifolii TaxID=157864 RepID=A0ABD2KZB6_9BILA